jgi:hypothetical protein
MKSSASHGARRKAGSVGPTQDGLHLMTGLETVAVGTIPKVLPPAARAVRKMLDNRHDQQSMAKILERAMTRAADILYRPNERPSTQDVAEVAQGAINIARTGSAQAVSRVRSAWRRRPTFARGHRPHKLQAVGPQAAMDELALWIRASAQDFEVKLLKAEDYARLAARLFLEEVLQPTVFAETADFSNRLTKAWLTQAQDAAASARLLKWAGYPILLTAAAAAAGHIFGLNGPEVLQIAEAVGASSVAIAAGVGLYDRERDPDTKAKSEAELVELLALLEQIAAFVLDLARVSFPEVPAPRRAIPSKSTSPTPTISPDGDVHLPKLLVALIDDLDNRLLPQARERAPLLAAHLKRVSDQLRLLQQQRPSFDELNLCDAVRDLWQALEHVGYKQRAYVPSPFELPKEVTKPATLPPPARTL